MINIKNIKKGNRFIKTVILVFIAVLSSCKDYLDVIPDNVATIDNAFTMRSEAEKYLYTCYSYMPKDGNVTTDPAILSGDEIWAFESTTLPEFDHRMFNIALGFQTAIQPVGNFHWDNLFMGLRDCNIFLENINKVPDLDALEKQQWIAEVKFLKAYYHFYLLRMYGPIPLIKENLPVDADITRVRVSRNTVDECINYIVELLNEVKDDLPATITDPTKMLGRVTKPIAYALKAKVLITAASPLFNGNQDMSTLRNKDGSQLFNQTASLVKWDSAAVACKIAIEVAEQAGHKLYKFNASNTALNITPATATQMSIRNVFTEKWNSEIIWANTQSRANLIQRLATPNVDHRYVDNPRVISELSPTLKIVDMFYSNKGIPTSEDRTWNANAPALRTATAADQLNIRSGYLTSNINFDREPRFYANLGFDGGVWFGQGVYTDSDPSKLYYVAGRRGQPNAKTASDHNSVTGYYIKKYVHYQNVQGSGVADYSVTEYPWPVIRLGQLYLWYAEALNEVNGPTDDVHKYIDLVRERAGLNTVSTSWSTYSSNPTKFTTKEGMQSIIRQEQLIEMAFEGQRFWDLRRWKEALREYNRKPVQGWDYTQSNPEFYYRQKTLFQQRFSLKDYFWPIQDDYLITNKNLVQNVGW